MPFYNFDPGEEGEDWEAELLEDNRRDYSNVKVKRWVTAMTEFLSGVTQQQIAFSLFNFVY